MNQMNHANNLLRFPSGPPPQPPSSRSLGTFSFASPVAVTSVSPTQSSPPPQQGNQEQSQPGSQSRQIHRNRISYSCHACRRRKVKCDRGHPICGNCTRTSDVCVYDEQTAKKRDPKGTGQQQKNESAPRTKRRRTWEGSEGSGASFAPNPTSNINPLESPLSGRRKQDDLETRMNRLAEIVDKWYKDAYSQGILPAAGRQTGSAGLGGGPFPRVGGDAGRSTFGSSGFPQDRPQFSDAFQQFDRLASQTDDSSPRSMSGSSASSTTQSPLSHTALTPGSSASGHSHSCQALGNDPISQPTVGPTNAELEAAKSVNCQDEVDDLGLGHLSIQGRGRSRYVGNSFWAVISNEITELNEVLKTNEPCGGHPAGPRMPEHVVKLFKKSPPAPPSNDALPSAAGASTASPASKAGKTPDFCGLSQFDKSSLLHFEPREIEKNPCEVIPLLLTQLPSKHQCDAFYKSFLSGVHPVVPLIHPPTFAKEYNAFWSWFPENIQDKPNAELLDNQGLLPLLMSVLYAGSISMSSQAITELTGETKEKITSTFYSATMNSLAATAFPRSPSLSSLIAFLIVQTCLIREEEPLTSCSFVGMAMRVAQSMGLHRDGSLFGLNEVECEVRRRVWWHIVYLDVQGAIATGLPPLGGSGEDLYDTRMVSELKDEFIGNPAGAATAAHLEPASGDESHPCKPFLDDSPNSPAMILAAGRYDTTIILRKIITRLFSIKPPQKTDLLDMRKTICALKSRLEGKIAKIPTRGIPELDFTPPRDQEFCKFLKTDERFASDERFSDDTERSIVFNEWARIMLSMLSDRAYGVLYQPFLKSSKSRLWDHARQCALKCCHGFLRKFVNVSKNPLYQPYQWFCPGTYQPLHATMILLIDLHERPMSAEAPLSRKYVDDVFDLFGEDGNSLQGGAGGIRPLMEGGREAWRMLGRLRKRAYGRAGMKVEGPGQSKEKDEMAPTEEVEMEYRPPTSEVEPTTPPAPPAYNRQRMPSIAAAGNLPAGEFEELLLMTDNNCEVNESEMGQSVSDTALKMWQGMVVEGNEPFMGQEKVANAPTPMAMHAGYAPNGPRMEDNMDFDWGEWDAVFGRYTAVDGITGDLTGEFMVE